VKTVVEIYRKWAIAARRQRAWLYRHAWQSALLVLLVFSLIEPLGCLAHCELWLFFGSAGTASNAQPAHHHNHSATATGVGTTAVGDSRVAHAGHSAAEVAPLAVPPGASHIHPIGHTPQATCFLTQEIASPFRSTNESSSAPAHEHLAALIMSISVALVLVARPFSSAPHVALPHAPYRPPIRPPIFLPA
jgi:hypothetical protein